MADAPLLTSIAFQGGGALGAYATGALEYIYEAEPSFKPTCVSGVSIGAFTAAIVASHPEDPVPYLKSFWKELTLSSPFLPPEIERRLALFGNPAFYRPRLDFFSLASWTYLYDLSPIRQTLRAMSTSNASGRAMSAWSSPRPTSSRVTSRSSPT